MENPYIALIITGLFSLLGGGTLVGWYMARPNRRKVNAEAEDIEISTLEKMRELVGRQVDRHSELLERIDKLNDRIEELEEGEEDRIAEAIRLVNAEWETKFKKAEVGWRKRYGELDAKYKKQEKRYKDLEVMYAELREKYDTFITKNP